MVFFKYLSLFYISNKFYKSNSASWFSTTICYQFLFNLIIYLFRVFGQFYINWNICLAYFCLCGLTEWFMNLWIISGFCFCLRYVFRTLESIRALLFIIAIDTLLEAIITYNSMLFDEWRVPLSHLLIIN